MTDDLGMQIEWLSDAGGAYTTAWEVPLTPAPGTYRFRVTGKRYTLTSRPFRVRRGATDARVAGNAVELGYPQPYLLNDWTYRPPDASGGIVTFLVDGHRRVVRRVTSTGFAIPGGRHVVIPAGGAHDRYGNANAQPLRVR